MQEFPGSFVRGEGRQAGSKKSFQQGQIPEVLGVILELAT